MEIESILSTETISADKKESYELVYAEFEEYIFDVFLSVVSSDRSIGILANIFVSG